jgi:hypothetical protein
MGRGGEWKTTAKTVEGFSCFVASLAAPIRIWILNSVERKIDV